MTLVALFWEFQIRNSTVITLIPYFVLKKATNKIHVEFEPERANEGM